MSLFLYHNYSRLVHDVESPISSVNRIQKMDKDSGGPDRIAL